MIIARLRLLIHWWVVFFKTIKYAIDHQGELPPRSSGLHDHASLISWDPALRWGARTTDLSCSCGKVFWTRPGYFTKRPANWVELRRQSIVARERVCSSCGVPVKLHRWPDGRIGVTHNEPLCEWFTRTATTAELDALARRLQDMEGL